MGNADRVLAVVLGGLLLLPLAACSRFRESAAGGLPVPGVVAANEVGSSEQGPAAVPAGYSQAIAVAPGVAPDVRPSAAAATHETETFPRLLGTGRAWGAGLGRLGGRDDGAGLFRLRFASAMADDAAASDRVAASGPGRPFEPVAAILADGCSDPTGLRAGLRSELWQGWCRIGSDYRNYYSGRTMRDLFLGVGAAAVLANTSLDDDFQGWYQRDVRSAETDHFCDFWKTFGEGQIFIPAYAGLAVVGGLFDDRPLIGSVGCYSDRVTRAYLVGTPPMLLMQALLGGSRPGECGVESQWKPFDDNNAVSGHAFIGAVPFITAAKTVENPWMKAAFYTFSTFPAWSRVNDDAHFLSQACLGWWMAYLACRAVDDTAQADRCYTLTPLLTPELTGLGLVVQR